MNIMWAALIIFSILYAVLFGDIANMSSAILSSSQDAIKAIFGMCGAFVFWSGLLKVAQKCGLVSRLAYSLRFFLDRLFPNSSKDKNVIGAIAMNLGADMLGLGNAATPFGVEAVKRMSELSGGKANDDIKMFLVLNAATIQFFPTTVIAMRSAAGAKNPSEILIATFVCSTISMIAGIVAAKFFSKIGRKKNG